jgi:hypothetical protein
MRIHLQNLHNKPFIYVIQIFVTYSLHVTLKYFINISLLSYCLVVSVQFLTTFLTCLCVVMHEEYHYFLSVTLTSRR